jgi:hypothetical protein
MSTGKKIGVTILQIIVFIVVYSIVQFIFYWIMAAIEESGALDGGITSYVKAFIFYTAAPALHAYIVLCAEIILMKFTKTPITKATLIVIGLFAAYEIIYGMVQVISVKGVFSWRTANQAWYYIMLFGLLLMSLHAATEKKKHTIKGYGAY